MEFRKDTGPVPLPISRNMKSAQLIEAVDALDVGDSGVVEAKLETVKSLLARYRKARVSELGAGYYKRYIVREVKVGVCRVWRVK